MPITRTLNIGVLAHVDAGKTSLTERLLFATGSIDRLGSVDDGSTQTDSGEIERQRGITVRSAVASFAVGDTQVNLIDTPGHSDFVAEVERALGVLDGAVLVLSAVEGVQAQTRVLMRTLRELHMPTLFFVNKIDRAGADPEAVLDAVRRRLTPRPVPMTRVHGAGTPAARAVPASLDDDTGYRVRVAETLAETDDTLLARVVDGPFPTAGELAAALAARTAEARAYPVYLGSALSGEGIPALLEGLTRLLPGTGTGTGTGTGQGELKGETKANGEMKAKGNAKENAKAKEHGGGAGPRGTVFAVERADSGTKTAYLRLYAGALAPRQRVTLHRRHPDGTVEEHSGQITSLRTVGPAGAVRGPLTPGNIARLRGLPDVRVGDRLGTPEEGAREAHFAAPTLQTVVTAREPGPGAAVRLHAALRDMAELDPLLHTRVLPDGTTSVLLYGEVQKEVIAATLARRHGIEADFAPSEVVRVERPVGSGEAYEEMGRAKPSPGGFWATVGLRVEPAPQGAGRVFRYETELGALPRALHTAVEETVHAALRSGGPRGWPVTDVTVTLIRSGFAAADSTAGDFRGLTPLVLGRALASAGTRVDEPFHLYEVEIPRDSLAPVTACLAAHGAALARTEEGPDATWRLYGRIPTRNVQPTEHRLPALTHGEGTWWARPESAGPERPAR